MTASIGNFSDEFWNVEVCDFSGWNIVYQRTRDGNKITNNYIDLLKHVTSAMETFGKSLLRAAKNSSLPELEHGKLKSALQTARVSVEAWGKDSMDAACALSDQISILSKHLNQAKDTRKSTDGEVRKRQNHLQDAVRKTKQAKKNVQTKFNEKTNCKKQRDVMDSKLDAKPRDIEKSQQALRKAEDSMAEAEEHHRGSVFKCNESLQEWKNTTHSGLGVMQDVEEARVKIVRDSMWTVANICSLLAVNCDQHQENIRVSLLSVDVGLELSTWVSQYRTSQSPPLPLSYTPIEGTSQFSTPLTTPATSKRSTVADAESNGNSSFSKSLTATPEPVYEATGVYDFVPRSESEVSLRVGEKVSMLDDTNVEWALIRNHAGETGFVPASFIRALPD